MEAPSTITEISKKARRLVFFRLIYLLCVPKWKLFHTYERSVNILHYPVPSLINWVLCTKMVDVRESLNVVLSAYLWKHVMSILFNQKQCQFFWRYVPSYRSGLSK